MKNINTFGLTELSQNECKSLDGGLVICTILGVAVTVKMVVVWIAGVTAASVVADVALNPSNTAEKFNEGYNSVRE